MLSNKVLPLSRDSGETMLLAKSSSLFSLELKFTVNWSDGYEDLSIKQSA
jgi:hypothetical protein